MEKSWTTKTNKSSSPATNTGGASATSNPKDLLSDWGPDITEDQLNELVVVLVVGKNMFGDDIFSYVQLPLVRFKDMAVKMMRNENFKSSDYGTVLAAGRGLPSAELKKEMRDTYNLFDIPPMESGAETPAAGAKPFIKIPEDLSDFKASLKGNKSPMSQPKFFGDEDEGK